MVCYTHLVGADPVVDVTPERWAQFLSLVDNAVDEGWLEAVNFEQLAKAYGITSHVNGGWLASLYSEYGSYGINPDKII